MTGLTLHQQAVAIIKRLAMDSMGGFLQATANSNQHSEELSINLVEGISGIQRERASGLCGPT